jgi:serine/threonine protein kinase
MTKEIVVIKYPKPNCVQISWELNSLKYLSHPHIITLLDSFQTPFGPAIVLPYARGGDLFHRIIKGRIAEDDVRRVIFDILEALSYLHSQDRWHRDIKPENILFMDESWSSVTLCDFGYSRRFEDGVCHDEYCGSFHYSSPEFSRHEAYTETVDVWALGITMFCCLTSRMPFHCHDPQAMRRDITSGLPHLLDFPELSAVSDECRDLLDWMLSPDPADRPSSSEVLEHRWFRPLMEVREVDAEIAIDVRPLRERRELVFA